MCSHHDGWNLCTKWILNLVADVVSFPTVEQTLQQKSDVSGHELKDEREVTLGGFFHGLRARLYLQPNNQIHFVV
jgi:hypothetical protein